MKIFELFPNPRFFGESIKLSDHINHLFRSYKHAPKVSYLYYYFIKLSVGGGGGVGENFGTHDIYIDTKLKSPNSPQNHKSYLSNVMA